MLFFGCLGRNNPKVNKLLSTAEIICTTGFNKLPGLSQRSRIWINIWHTGSIFLIRTSILSYSLICYTFHWNRCQISPIIFIVTEIGHVTKIFSLFPKRVNSLNKIWKVRSVDVKSFNEANKMMKFFCPPFFCFTITNKNKEMSNDQSFSSRKKCKLCADWKWSFFICHVVSFSLIKNVNDNCKYVKNKNGLY